MVVRLEGVLYASPVAHAMAAAVCLLCGVVGRIAFDRVGPFDGSAARASCAGDAKPARAGDVRRAAGRLRE